MHVAPQNLWRSIHIPAVAQQGTSRPV